MNQYHTFDNYNHYDFDFDDHIESVTPFNTLSIDDLRYQQFLPVFDKISKQVFIALSLSPNFFVRIFKKNDRSTNFRFFYINDRFSLLKVRYFWKQLSSLFYISDYKFYLFKASRLSDKSIVFGFNSHLINLGITRKSPFNRYFSLKSSKCFPITRLPKRVDLNLFSSRMISVLVIDSGIISYGNGIDLYFDQFEFSVRLPKFHILKLVTYFYNEWGVTLTFSPLHSFKSQFKRHRSNLFRILAVCSFSSLILTKKYFPLFFKRKYFIRRS